MTLPTRSHLPIALPLNVTAPDVLLERLRAGVGVGYAATLGLLNLRGYNAGTLVRQVYSTGVDTVGAVARVSDGLLAWLRRDELVLLSPGLADALDRLQAASAESLLTLTDLTHGRGFLVLAGARAADVLPKVCSLNFSEAAFPDHRAAQAMLAKVRALILRADMAQLPVYHVIVDRSLAAYGCDVLLDAAQEFDGVTFDYNVIEGNVR
ncbi:MAG: hypothetical protein HZC41_14130 [Chloroflexi bacterium]|nr:hypothetical protein [Chloroflexota bacterium]